MANTSIKFDLSAAIHKEINTILIEQISAEWDRKIRDLNLMKNEVVAGIVLNMTKRIDMQTLGGNLVITIKEISNDKPQMQ